MNNIERSKQLEPIKQKVLQDVLNGIPVKEAIKNTGIALKTIYTFLNKSKDYRIYKKENSNQQSKERVLQKVLNGIPVKEAIQGENISLSTARIFLNKSKEYSDYRDSKDVREKILQKVLSGQSMKEAIKGENISLKTVCNYLNNNKDYKAYRDNNGAKERVLQKVLNGISIKDAVENESISLSTAKLFLKKNKVYNDFLKNKKKETNDKIQQAVCRIQKGEVIKTVCKELNLSVKTFYEYRKKHNLTIVDKEQGVAREKEYKYILDKILQGETITQAIKNTSFSKSSIHNLLQKDERYLLYRITSSTKKEDFSNALAESIINGSKASELSKKYKITKQTIANLYRKSDRYKGFLRSNDILDKMKNVSLELESVDMAYTRFKLKDKFINDIDWFRSRIESSSEWIDLQNTIELREAKIYEEVLKYAISHNNISKAVKVCATKSKRSEQSFRCQLRKDDRWMKHYNYIKESGKRAIDDVETIIDSVYEFGNMKEALRSLNLPFSYEYYKEIIQNNKDFHYRYKETRAKFYEYRNNLVMDLHNQDWSNEEIAFVVMLKPKSVKNIIEEIIRK